MDVFAVMFLAETSIVLRMLMSIKFESFIRLVLAVLSVDMKLIFLFSADLFSFPDLIISLWSHLESGRGAVFSFLKLWPVYPVKLLWSY